MKNKETHLPLVLVAVVAVVMLLPFLGLTEFSTKGEPREAVVALSMLKEGNWILPVNNGCDIPYKPPFFHYCIAVLSLLAGGISEYTSRLPSALSLIGLAVGCFVFYRRRLSTTVAVSGALLLLTAFEVHRAGINCRVDMLLTAFTVGSLLLFYRWWERGSRGLPVLAILCMSGAVMTKGPVGFILPCFVMGVFSLIRGEKFWRTFFSYVLFALLSCVLPAIWYILAWQEGGQQFLDLVWEENIGRMTGSMSYESHEHPFTYNFVCLLTGWAPWTLLLLISLFSKPWKHTGSANTSRATFFESKGAGAKFQHLRVRLMQIAPVKLFTWLSFVLVLFFYCLPSSKRSVYLLPCYPFMAMLIAQYIEWLFDTHRRGVLRAWVCVASSLAFVLTLAFVAVKSGLVPDTIFHGKHAAENVAMLNALRHLPLGVFTLLLVALPVVASVDSLHMAFGKRTRDSKKSVYFAIFCPVVLLLTALDGVYQPAVMNVKSLRPLAEELHHRFKGEPLYQYVESPMMHFFGADYYLDDSIDQFEKSQTPERGVLIVPSADFETLAKRHTDYKFTHVYTSEGTVSEIKGTTSFYRFEKNK